MADSIEASDQDLSSTIFMMRGCEQELASGCGAPRSNSVSPAMDAFLYEMYALDAAIAQYKALLQNDIAALESAQSTLQSADDAAARALQG